MKRFTQYKNYRWIMYLIIFAMLAGPQITHLTKVAYAAVFNTGVVADNVTDQCDLRIEQTSNGIGVWNPRAIERNGFDAETMVESLMVPEWYLDSWNPGPGESHNALIADVGQLYEVNCSTPANGGTGSGIAGNTSVKDVRPWLDYVQYDQDSDTTLVKIAYPTTMLTNNAEAWQAMWYNPAGSSPELHSIVALHEDREHGDAQVDHTVLQYRWRGNVAANFSFMTRYQGEFGAIYAIWQRNDMTLDDGATLDTSSWGNQNRNGAIMPEMVEPMAFTATNWNQEPASTVSYYFLPVVTRNVVHDAVNSTNGTIPAPQQ